MSSLPMMVKLVIGLGTLLVTVVGWVTSPRREPRRLCAMERALGGPRKVCELLSSGDVRRIGAHLGRVRLGYIRHIRHMPGYARRIQPRFRNAWHAVDGEHYFVDAHGRPTRAFTRLPQRRARRGVRCARSQHLVGKWGDQVGPDDYDGGHLIAAQLGGYGRRANLVPKAKDFNRGVWKRVEQAVAGVVRELRVGQLGYYVRAEYADEHTLVPSRIGLWLMDFQSGRSCYVEFDNRGRGGLLAWLGARHALEFLKPR